MQSVTTKVKAIPEGYHSVTTCMVVQGASKLIDFAKRTFNAKEIALVKGPDGLVAHAEVKIGDSIVMIGDATSAFPHSPSQVYVYVDNVDATYRRALAAGATVVQEPKDQFYGDRNALVKDPLGNIWGIGTHVEDVSSDELERRMKSQASQ